MSAACTGSVGGNRSDHRGTDEDDNPKLRCDGAGQKAGSRNGERCRGGKCSGGYNRVLQVIFFTEVYN